MSERERSDAAHDPMLAVSKFELTEGQLTRFYAVLQEHERRFDRLAIQFGASTLPLVAAKYASERALCSLIAILGEGKKS